MRDLSGRTLAVTGGAGFIGSSLSALLLARGARVRVLDDMSNGSRDKLQDALSEAGASEHELTVIEGDVRDEAALERAFRGADAVLHLACLGVRHSLHAPLENHEVNARGSLLALEVARRVGVPRFVHVSTSEVYGTGTTPQMAEVHPTLPHTVYGASKLAGEAYARAAWLTWRYPTVVIRPFNAYGPRAHHEGDSGEVIPRFLLRALSGRPLVVFGDGLQTRDFTFVTDTARGIAEVGLHDDAPGATVNLGAGSEVSILELAARVKQVAGRPDLPVEHQAPRPGDVRRLHADARLARARFGFAPEVSLADGLARLVAWYRARPGGVEALLRDEVVRSWER